MKKKSVSFETISNFTPSRARTSKYDALFRGIVQRLGKLGTDAAVVLVRGRHFDCRQASMASYLWKDGRFSVYHQKDGTINVTLRPGSDQRKVKS